MDKIGSDADPQESMEIVGKPGFSREVVAKKPRT
jgi:hypothetical protein